VTSFTVFTILKNKQQTRSQCEAIPEVSKEYNFLNDAAREGQLWFHFMDQLSRPKPIMLQNA